MKYILLILAGISFLCFIGGIIWGCLARGKKSVRKGNAVARELFNEKLSRGTRYEGGKHFQKSFVKGTGVAVEYKAKISWNEIRLALIQGRLTDVGFVFLALFGLAGFSLSAGSYLLLYTGFTILGWILIGFTVILVLRVITWLRP